MLNYLTDCVSAGGGAGKCEVCGSNGRKMKPQSERAKMALQLIATKCSAQGNKQSPIGPINFEKLRNLYSLTLNFFLVFC